MNSNSFRLALLALLCLPQLYLNAGPKDPAPKTARAEGSLELLMAGNSRFEGDRARHPDQTMSRRKEIAGKQEPFAIVLTCADSRLSPEIYFDQGLGDLFVIRNAGNVLNDHVIGSMEYAVDHLNVPLIMVIGHERCGAVSAAVAGGHAPGHIAEIVASITPAVKATVEQEGDKVNNTVIAHAQMTAATLRSCGPIIAEAVKTGKVKVVAARYDLDSGRVEILPELAPAHGAHAADADEAKPASPAHPAHGAAHAH
jgi:carbonic anhydrase